MASQLAMFEKKSGPEITGKQTTIACDVLPCLSEIQPDRMTIPQWRLDLANRTRTSVFPWRGQFSPELIELLLTTFAGDEATVLDPFVGSGTTLFEATRKGLNSFGAEINPAAVTMASATCFVSLDRESRRECLARFRSLVERLWPIEVLQSIEFGGLSGSETTIDQIQGLLVEAHKDRYAFNLVANLAIRLSDDLKSGRQIGSVEALRHAHALERLVLDLPFSTAECNVFHADARSLPLPSQSIDLVITSPPYINVFNYHQNYRAASELLGWNVLEIAKSEFGSNRKNRGNRFLTVIQYAVDMQASLHEMRRLLKVGGRLIIIVGRESNVRGVRFENARIVSALATGGAGFILERRQERTFKTKFGQTIYEDVLHLVPREVESTVIEDWGRRVGEAALFEALADGEPDVAVSIQAALANSAAVQASPVFAGISRDSA